MREARLQVASFELSDCDSSMDPKKAIKQYSRSAADAETPLPQELRPESSLKTTMTYLLHNIINLCDDNNTSIGDWFHFVWDRTRGIRKDITQQELCSPVTVELVEQCVRFHIHCSARLVAEDPSTFDQKINTENLTKCLQTLKYMYEDLKLKNIKCPNEAEFRAYVVLLNLNESGNFLWEIKRLEKSILNSKEVRFALDVYFAVANHNYVKFFNLLRESSYMSACLLMRYFTQVRIKAISIIMRSYTPKKVGFKYSISYLTEILAFEDFESTVNFLTHHGLMCDVDADIVYLDRSMFTTGDAPFQMQRAHMLVDEKMQTTIAESVCGGELPSPDCFLKLVPHSSFDNDGFLKRESFYAEDQNGPSPNVNKENVFKIPKGSPPVSPGRSMFQRAQKNDQPDGTANENPFYKSPSSNPFVSGKLTAQQLKNISKKGSSSDTKPLNPFASKLTFGSPTPVNSIFGPPTSHIFDSPKPTVPQNPSPMFGSTKAFQEPTAAKSVFGSFTTSPTSSFSFVKPIEPSSTFSFVSPSNQLAVEAEKKRNEQAAEAMRLAEEKRDQEREAHAQEEREREQRERLIRKHQEVEQARRETEKRREEEDEARRQSTQQACELFLDQLLSDIVDEDVKLEAKQSVMLFVELPEEFYDALEFDVSVDELYKIYKQEFLAYVNQTKMKYEIMNKFFNHWRQTTRDEIRKREKLSTIGCAILNLSLEEQAGNMYHPEQNAALSNKKQYLSGSPQSITLPDINLFKTINLFNELKIKLTESYTKIYLKLVVSVPMRNEEKCLGFSSFMNKWLSKSFGEIEHDDGVLYFEEKMLKGTRTKLSICIRKVQGAALIDEKGHKSADVIDNSHGIIFFSNTTNLQASRKRLQNILDKLDLPVPVSIIVYKSQIKATDEEDVAQFFDLSTEVNVAIFEISIYYECHEKNKNLTQVTVEACQFINDFNVAKLLNEDCKLLDLQMQNMLDFFQITIGDEMWQRIELSCNQSGEFKTRMTEFNNVITVYNLCIDKLMQIVTNDFRRMPLLPLEFRKRLTTVDTRIPQNFEHFPENWRSSRNQTLLIEFIHELKFVKMQNDKFTSFDDFKCKLMLFLSQNMITNKDKVFQCVVAKVISHLYSRNLVKEEDVKKAIQSFSWLQILAEIAVGRFNEIYQRKQQNVASAVIYQKKDLRRYKDVPWWYSIAFSPPSDPSDEPQTKKMKLAPASSSEIEAILRKSANSLNKLNNNIETYKEVSSKTRETSKDFDKYLYNIEENFRSKISSWEEKFKE